MDELSAPGDWILLATADLKADGRPHETEMLPQLIHKKPLVGKVERRCHVGEEHERWRRDTGLRRVENAHMPALLGSQADARP